MIRFLRNQLTSLLPATPVLRVECLGDSMMLGAGVLSDQAFPCRLEHHLNAMFPASYFEAVNRGINGANLWNAWAGFAATYQPGACDLVVISVCNNDHRMLSWWGVPYDGARDDETWDETGPWRDLMVELLDTIDAFVESHAVPVVLYHVDVRDDCVPAEVLARLFAGRRFLFVDAAADLRELLAATPSVERAATPFDGHPSSLIQDMLARHVAQQVRKHTLLGQKTAQPPFSPAEVARLAAIQGAMVEYGSTVGNALAWGERTFAAKEPTWRRLLALDGDTAASSAAIAELRRTLDAQGTAWAEYLHLTRWSDLLHEMLKPCSVVVTDIEWCLYLTEELSLILTLMDRSIGAAGAVERLLGRATQLGAANAASPAETAGWPDRLARTEAVLAGIRAIAAPQSAAFAKVKPVLDAAETLAARLHGLSKTLGGRQTGIDAAADRIVAIGLNKMAEGMRPLDDLVGILGRLAPAEPFRFARHTSRIAVTIGVARPQERYEEGLQLHTGLHYRLPSCVSLTASHCIGLSVARQTYVFDFPLLVHGEVFLELRGKPELMARAKAAGLSIERICVTNACVKGGRTVEVEVEPGCCPIADFTQASAMVAML